MRNINMCVVIVEVQLVVRFCVEEFKKLDFVTKNL